MSFSFRRETEQQATRRGSLLRQKDELLDRLAELESQKEAGTITAQRYEKEFRKAKSRLSEILGRLGASRTRRRPEMPETLALDSKEIEKKFGYSFAVRNVTLQVRRGEFVALFGSNGAGKTTFLKIAATLMRPTKGTLSDRRIRYRQAAGRGAAQIGFLSHNTFVYRDLSPLENLKFFCRLYGVPDSEERLLDLLDRVGLRRRAGEILSAPFRAACSNGSESHAPCCTTRPLILLDEPYTGLDANAAQTLNEMLDEARGRRQDHHPHNSRSRSGTARRNARRHSGPRQRRPRRLRERYRCPRSLCAVYPAGRTRVKPVAAIVFKDIAIEYKNKEAFSSMLLFGLLVVVVFSFAFEGSDRKALAPGMLWVAYSFAGILGLNRSLNMEVDNDCLQGLLLSPVSRGDLYLGKVAGNLIFTILAELVILPFFIILNNLAFDRILLWIAGITLLGTLGLCCDRHNALADFRADADEGSDSSRSSDPHDISGHPFGRTGNIAGHVRRFGGRFLPVVAAGSF